ncbi:GNAT family N-acetyltransferase [Actinomadura viridis]|uniref:GNAT family N-acetyltransferase n=1 Tax=Actinomadura viridis TaxID=58110 RepID=UPI0036A8CA7F
MPTVLTMRLATSADRPAVAEMIRARCDWMERRGIPSWRPSLDDLVSQCDNPCEDVWLLEQDGARIIGRITAQTQGPPWWTEEELAAPALYINTSLTDPAVHGRRLGELMAHWAVDRAARQGLEWVRRDTPWPRLAEYNRSQGFRLVREVPRTHVTLFLLARRAEPLDLAAWFRTGTPGPPCPA